MNTWSFLLHHRDEILSATLAHIVLVLISMSTAIVVGVSLGLLIVHNRLLRRTTRPFLGLAEPGGCEAAEHDGAKRAARPSNRA